jgi:acyl-CoA synthetase (AMP-forming)/AMP-acid ligase II
MNSAVLLTQAATSHPDAIAIRHGERTYTYGEFAERAARVGSGLLDLGLHPGDRVGVLQRNGPELLETIYGGLLAGLVVVPVNARLHPNEIAYIGADSAWRALVHTEEFNVGMAGVADAMPQQAFRISTAPTTGECAYADLIAAASPLPTPAERATEDPCWLFYTSGTTGRPKGVTWTHRTVYAVVLGYLADIHPMRSTDVVLHQTPLSHASGIVALACVARAAQNVIPVEPSFSPQLLFDLVQRHRVTVISVLVPTQILRLLEDFVPHRHDLSSLRCIFYGAAPMYADQIRRALDIFGPIFVHGYGQGESPNTISYLSAADHARLHQTGDERLASVGVARTGVEIRIADGEDNPLPPGQVGEVLVRGDVVMAGYWDNEAATTEALRGGWLHTGDVGRMDDHGYLTLLDRCKDLIISGGNNVYPREVEEVLLLHPAVAECAVIGVPDDMWGESVHAIVCPHSEITVTAADLITHCAGHLAGYKKPRSVEIRGEPLPRNAYGKVLKRELRELHRTVASQ